MTYLLFNISSFEGDSIDDKLKFDEAAQEADLINEKYSFYEAFPRARGEEWD